MRDIPSHEAATPDEFADEIAPGARPAVLRAIANDWPLVGAARQGAYRCRAMLSGQATDVPIKAVRTDPANEGRFHYTPDGLALNFVSGRTSLPIFLAALEEQESSDRPFTMAAKGVVAEPVLPAFASAHPVPYAPAAAEPRFWIGNAAKVATHNDPSDNLAVVVAGRRRFTLFPLPANQRTAWRAMFEYYVFQSGDDPATHIAPEVAGILGQVTQDTIARMRQSLIEALGRDAAGPSGPKKR
jgi:hypothetical protein